MGEEEFESKVKELAKKHLKKDVFVNIEYSDSPPKSQKGYIVTKLEEVKEGWMAFMRYNVVDKIAVVVVVSSGVCGFVSFTNLVISPEENWCRDVMVAVHEKVAKDALESDGGDEDRVQIVLSEEFDGSQLDWGRTYIDTSLSSSNTDQLISELQQYLELGLEIHDTRGDTLT